MRIRKGILSTLLLLVLTASLAYADGEDQALTIFQTALDLAKQNCLELGRNEACYGHDFLTAEPRLEAEAFIFKSVGDIEDLAKIQSLRLGGMDVTAGTWGIALMQLRANLPASHPENVTLVAFGDVMLENAVLPPTQAEIQVQAQQNVNVRQRPVMSAGVIGTLKPEQTVTVVDRLADSSWLRVILPGTEQTGWVLSDLISAPSDLSHLNVTNSDAPYIQEPMQAFYFSSGSTAISPLPDSGLLIQTPEGVGEVQLLINEINVQLGSTVFFQMHPGQMTIATLEGHADVRADGIEQTAYAGTQVTIPLTADLKPAGPPSPPQPYDQTRMNQLPTNVLTRPVTAAPAMSYSEIQEHLGNNPDSSSNSTDGSSNLPDQNNQSSNGDNDNCPGQSCNAPGHGGSCPGNSCNAPGHDKESRSPPGQNNNSSSDKDNDDCPGNSCNAPGHNKDKNPK